MVDTHTDDATFTISRSFDAPRDLIWKLNSDAGHLAKWWGPAGFTWFHGVLDFRPGGRFHYGMRAPNGSEMWGKFEYREIVPQEKIVFISSFSDKDGNTVRAPFPGDVPLQILNDLRLADADGKTVLTLTGMPFNATAEERAFFITMRPSMNQGFGGTFNQLDQYLAELKGAK